MKKVFRFVIIFAWCVAFGFFAVTSYINDAVTVQKKITIMVGLIVVLGVYLIIEWYVRSTSPHATLARKKSKNRDPENG